MTASYFLLFLIAQVLRISADGACTVLFIPVLRSLLSTVACERVEGNETWFSSNLDCYDGGHIVLIGLALLLCVAWVAFACVAATTLMDRRRASSQPLARADGRVHAYALIAIAIACAAFSLVEYVSPWVLSIASLALGVYLVY